MGDVADILGMGAKPAVSVTEEASRLLGEKPKSGKASKKAKPKGMSRELFSLMGADSIAPMVVTNKSSGPAFKTKRFAAAQGKWVWAPFRNPARTDNKMFHHWVKADMQHVDYSYARFNVKVDSIKYTDQEYEKYLQDPLWTRSETDHLMHLCYKYDLRWPIIVDRYDACPPRPTEDLQARYYAIIIKLRDARLDLADTVKRNEPHSLFDLEYEKIRRAQQELLFRKTKEDESEEARLREELKTIDSNIKKLKKSTKWAVGENKALSKSEAKQAAHVTTISAAPVDTLQHQPMAGQPCLQSARLLAAESGVGLSKSLVKKMQVFLKELLSVPDTLLPTRAVCDMYDQLRSDSITLLTLQTALAKKEKEVAHAKAQFPSIFPGGPEVVVPHHYSSTPSAELALMMPPPPGAPPTPSASALPPVPSLASPRPSAVQPTTQVATKQPKKVANTKRKSSAAGMASVPSSGSIASLTSTGGAASTPTGEASVTAVEPVAVHPVPVGPQKQASKRARK